MRVVTFQSVLYAAAELLGMNPVRDLNPDRARTLVNYLNRHVATGWRFDFWPEWLLTEQRRFRPAYAAAENITAGTERFFFADGKYYQPVRDQSPAAQAPATLTSGVYVENSAYWAASAQSYTGSDWATGTVYTVTNGSATKVRDPLTGLFYQVHTAHTAGATIDLTKMGRLTAFDKYVGYTQSGETEIDGVKQASRRDPRTFPENPWRIAVTKSNRGIQFPTEAPGEVWLQFRTVPPVFTSTKRSDTTTYASGVTVYDVATGDCYTSNAAIAAGESPTTHPAKWDVVEFPMVLADFVARAVQADGLRDQKQTDRARAEMTAANDDLQDALDEELAGQGQYDTATVVMS